MTNEWQPVRYYAETDTMVVELRPWPGGDGDAVGYDAGPDLVIHDAPDGAPWLWEIKHASQHPEHIAAALAAMRQLSRKRRNSWGRAKFRPDGRRWSGFPALRGPPARFERP